MTLQLANLQHVTYSYDDINRLTNAVSSVNQYSASYTYDNDGHMTTRNFSGINNSFNRETASHRIANIIENGFPKSVSYDSRGRLTSDALSNWTTYEYNRSNLPLYMNSGNKFYRFGYNEKGERITKDFEDDSTETKEKYLLDYLGRTLVVYDNNRNKEGIINGNGLVGSIAVTDSSTYYYYFLKDHLGNIRTTVDANGIITTARDFAPYGEVLREYTAEKTVDRFQYTEKERDKESRDIYFGARSLSGYFPFWKSVDPLSEKNNGWSPYNYVNGNPLSFIDEHGDSLTYVIVPNKPKLFFIDTKVVEAFQKIMSAAEDNDVPFEINSIYRTKEEQQKQKDKWTKRGKPQNAAKPGTSSHEAGLAFDFNTYSLTNEQYDFIIKISEINGFKRANNERWHLEAEPKEVGYKDKYEAIEENHADYQRVLHEWAKHTLISPHRYKSK